MNEVKRYSLVSDESVWEEVSPVGEFIKYKDYAALEAECENWSNQCAALIKERDALAAENLALKEYGAAPPVENEVISIAQRLVSHYIANNGRSSEFICCISPSRSSIGTGGVWDDWRALNKAIKSAGGSVSDE